MEKWREQLYLEHGLTWKQHKYIKKIPGNPPRYIYPEDLAKKAKNGINNTAVKLNRKLRGMSDDQISYNGGKFTFDRLDDGKNRSTTRPIGNSILRTKYNGNKDVSLRDYGNNGYSEQSQYKNGRLRNGYPDDAVYKKYEYHNGSDSYKYVDHKTNEQVKEIAKKQQATATMARTKKGTEAGRKRVAKEQNKKKAEATQKRIQKGLEAARERKLKDDRSKKRNKTAINKQVTSAVAAQEKGKKYITKKRTSKGDGTVMKSTLDIDGLIKRDNLRGQEIMRKNAQMGRLYKYPTYEALIYGPDGLAKKGPNGKRKGIDRHSVKSGSDYSRKKRK